MTVTKTVDLVLPDNTIQELNGSVANLWDTAYIPARATWALSNAGTPSAPVIRFTWTEEV